MLRATPTHLSFNFDTIPPGTVSIDVRFDDRRIWSIEVGSDPARLDIPWPAALQPHLTGHTRLSIVDSATHAEIAACDARFDEQPHQTNVVNAAGSPLMVNKWGRLGLSLEAMGAALQRRIIENADGIVSDLTEMGLRPFVVGGTLLGAVRDGRLLPHDDDADIAYLSVHTDPADVALEAFKVGRKLTARGYHVHHHSATHMQLLFAGQPGEADTYIDVFAAFFTTDGNINQPFHVRAPMTQTQMLPFGTVTLEGVSFPAPADTNHWLTINYDKNWRTPIPGFKLETPQKTRERFERWFGGYNFQREFWDEYFSGAGSAESAKSAKSAEWQVGREWLLAQKLATPFVVDLGCGAGDLTRSFAQADPARHVLGLDFSSAALTRAASHSLANLSFGDLNLNRLESITFTREFGVAAPFTVIANHLIEQLGHRARANVWRMARMALRSGGAAWFTFNTIPTADVTPDDPTGWHLTRDQVAAEASEFGLAATFTALESDLDREPTGVCVRLAGSEHEPDPDPERDPAPAPAPAPASTEPAASQRPITRRTS